MHRNKKERYIHFSRMRILVVLTCVYCSFVSFDLKGQNSYRLRFNLTGLDTINSIACYDIEIANLGPDDWALGGLNINILYDGSFARFIVGSDMIINNDDMDYALGPTQSNLIAAPELSNIPYNMTLGYLRLSVTTNLVSSGLLIPSDSTWVPFFHLCFEVLEEDLTDPNTCFQMNFLNDDLRASNIFPSDIVQELNFDGPGNEVSPGVNVDLVPDQSFDACFVVDEDTEELCMDGLDNDEDGLIDCLDPGCGNLCSEDNSTTCNDGIDNDNDGMIDCDDDSCLTQSGQFTSKEPDNCPDLNNGEFVFSFGSDAIEISIDGGLSYVNDTVITGLSSGTYLIFYRDVNTLCEQESFFSPIVLDDALECMEVTPEECSDGIDNDGDGLLDCDDSDCNGLDVCSLSESSTGACQDGVDNDGDGLTDCQDSDCRFFDFCVPPSSDLIYVPSAFLLNGSNLNSRIVLLVKGNEIIQILSFAIFDRNGNKVFKRQNLLSDDPNLIWDGTFNNRKVSSGVYVYVIEVDKDGITSTFTGDITALK